MKLDSKAMNNQTSKRHIPLIGTLLVCLLIAVLTLFSSDSDPNQPYGKITSPIAGTTTSTTVSVTAETRNIEPGQYIWLVVDKPGINLCWPKIQVEPDIKFKTIIYEKGKKGPYTLSLYVVHKTINDQWQEWLGDEIFGGLPMLPEKRRLDSVRLILGK
jgi:hypothetical protein